MSQWSEYCEALQSNCFFDQKSLVDFIRPFLSLLLVMQVWNRQIRKCDAAAEKCPVDIRFSHAFRSNMYVLGFGLVGLSSGQNFSSSFFPSLFCFLWKKHIEPESFLMSHPSGFTNFLKNFKFKTKSSPSKHSWNHTWIKIQMWLHTKFCPNVKRKMRHKPSRDNFSRGREKLIEEDFVFFFSHTQRK